MSIVSKEIKINFISNFKKFEKIEFKLDILYYEKIENGKTIYLNTNGLNKLPYFTLSVKYPLDRLLKSLKTYQEKVDFFFDKNEFEKVLRLNTDISDFSIDEDPNVIGEHNVMVMIELLFPTKFTVINNFHTSYDNVFVNSSLKRMLFNPVTEKNYSYLKLSDKEIYTFTRLVWLNDLLNHPKYREFIDNFIIFWNWYKRETNKITIKENEIKNNIITLVELVLTDISDAKPTEKTTELAATTKTKIEAIKTLKKNIKEGNELNNIEIIKTFYNRDIKEKINKNIIEINKNIDLLKKELENKQKYEGLIKRSSEKYSSSPYTEYRTFINFKNKYTNDRYSYPKYISSNDDLKDFFDKIDNEGTAYFFNMFEIIYNMYISGSAEKIDYEHADTLRKIMNTGINIVYPDSNSYLSSYSNTSYYEIYIMVDFIQGKVDDENSNEIFCPYVGDYLGNMFELLFQIRLYGKTDKQDIYRWDVTRNRVSFSIKNMELIVNEENKQNNARNLEEKISDKQENPKIINKSNEINESKIIYDLYSNNKEVANILEELQTKGKYINENSFLSDIKEYNRELYNIILESYKDNTNQNPKLLKKIIKLQFTYEGENKLNKDKIDTIKKDINYDPNKIINLDKDILFHKFYIEILKKIYEIENKKNSIGGTKKKNYTRNKIQTRKKK
jgi:hypothetical protein